MDVVKPPAKKESRPFDPFRRAIVGGLAVLLPPLLTIVIFLWIGRTVAVYVLDPTENLFRWALVNQFERNIEPASAVPPEQVIDGGAMIDGRAYRQAADGQFVPAEHYDEVQALVGPDAMPSTASGVYERYVQHTYLQRQIVIPIFLCLFVLLLYLLGKFLAAGVGRFFWTQFEGVIIRLPLVRNVYSSVKQVTDFMFSEREIEYTRVVAVEYPRKGIWQLGFVTGESLMDVACAANEPVLAVFFPCSPMPFTGFTAIVKRSETIDLNITMEQAIQFIVSCGVVAPPHQLSHMAASQHRELHGELPPLAAGS